MSSITEKRQKILIKKLQEMGDIGVGKRSAEESPFFDQPIKLGTEDAIEVVSPEEEEVPTAEPSGHKEMPIATEEAPAKPTRRKSDATGSGLSFEEYEARFFVPSRDARGKVGFTIHWEVLQTLRDVLNDVRSRATLTSYIENIIIEHLREHQAMPIRSQLNINVIQQSIYNEHDTFSSISCCKHPNDALPYDLPHHSWVE